MSKEMTPKEMLKTRLEGATYQQIADICGISRQATFQAIALFVNKMSTGKRGHGFYCDEIAYEGLYEYFLNNEDETVSGFADEVRMNDTKTKSLLRGNPEACFTIEQIKRVCEICGKTFEEVFKER